MISIEATEEHPVDVTVYRNFESDFNLFVAHHISAIIINNNS